MNYEETKVVSAFQIYMRLARTGVASKEDVHTYKEDDDVRSLLDLYAEEVGCTIIVTSEQLFLVAKSRLSSLHVSNDWLKRHYFKGGRNDDIYLMYVAIIVLFGAFYDSYETKTATRDFIGLGDWSQLVDDRLEELKQHTPDTLKQMEQTDRYNWTAIIAKWAALDTVKETAQRQKGKTLSRISFLHTVKEFLADQQLVTEIGNDELTLTEKAKTIVERYFMDSQYNNDILQVLYQWKEENDADN